MQHPKEQQSRALQLQKQEQEEQEQMTGKNKTALNERLINWVKKNEYEEVERCIKKKADINYEENNKKKWTAFIWACCQGYTRIVKLMIAKGAALNYMEVKPQNRHVVIGTTKQMKPNPLHWASFKQHLDIVQLLLNNGVHWQDVDSCGNNSVMLSAAANCFHMFKKYLQFGVLLDCKNSRGHTAKDLTTNTDILDLINKHDKELQCSVSKQVFKEKEVKHWCWVCLNFSNGANFKMQWALKGLHSQQKQQIDGRCNKCWEFAAKMQSQLEEAIGIYQEDRLMQVMNAYREKFNQIDVIFFDRCEQMLNKLHVQNSILHFAESVGKVDNYKVILKSVNKIYQMLKDAVPIGMDANVIQVANKAIQRLNAQRNLRYQIDNIDTSVATREGVAKLTEVYINAETKNVSSEYLSVAWDIKEKMNRSIKVQDLYQLFVEYPLRPDPYPEPLVIDFKTKKPLDPETKKPTDAVNLLPKKKKGGKKEPKFDIPQWATQLKDLTDKIKQQEQLLARREQLGLSKQFCMKVQEIIVLMKREGRYRKDIDTLQAMVEEGKKKKK